MHNNAINSVGVEKWAAKKLEIDSKYAHLDIDGDGVVSDEEMMREERMIELADKRSDMENEDKKQDAHRNMAWFGSPSVVCCCTHLQ